MTQTGIMATVADVRCSEEFVEALYSRGMRAVRINSAHVAPDTFRQMVRTIRAVSPEISILMDTKGPEIRTTALSTTTEPELNVGEKLTLVSGHGTTWDTPGRIVIAVDNLERYVSTGGKVLLDDGEIELEIIRVDGAEIGCIVTKGGRLGSRKTVAFPNMEVPPLPAVSDRDRLNIAVAVEERIAMIAHSFVRSATDVEAVRELIEGSDVSLYSKIECREALDNLDSIVAASDGILVARGDLGANIPLHTVPEVQLRAVRAARREGKPTILATQILQSMITHPTPTRAELSDITLAVMEGFDWLLLTGETAQGEYPRECIDTLRETIDNAERNHLRCLINC